MDNDIVRVVLIEDDPMVQEVNRQFVERVAGFQVAGSASTGAEGLKLAAELKPDLLLLDVYMPSLDGVSVLRQLRAEAADVDVIVVTAAKDTDTVQRMLRQGAVDYIIKPFKFERVERALLNYKKIRDKLRADSIMTQAELDPLLHSAKPAEPIHPDTPEFARTSQEELPKGLNAVTMRGILLYLNRQELPLSAEDVADGVGIARVTARRYLEYLEKSDQVVLDILYGGVGRPVNRYALQRHGKS